MSNKKIKCISTLTSLFRFGSTSIFESMMQQVTMGDGYVHLFLYTSIVPRQYAHH